MWCDKPLSNLYDICAYGPVMVNWTSGADENWCVCSEVKEPVSRLQSLVAIL
jgi:hypothetical protein